MVRVDGSFHITTARQRKRGLPISPSDSPIKPSVIAAVLLVALDLAQDLGSTLPSSATEVIALTDVSRSQAYEMRGRLHGLLSDLHQPPGRSAIAAPEPDRALAVAKAVRDFVMLHPGVVCARGARCIYGEPFRRFVLGLFAPDGVARGMTVEQAADAIGVPMGTLKDWLRTPAHDSVCDTPQEPEHPAQVDPLLSCAQPQIATLLSEYEAWDGCLSSFCLYARDELRLSFGRTFITDVLIAAGLHEPASRSDPHQAPWSRGSMHASFPGLQWFGDGKQLTIDFRGQRFLFNLEANVDAASNAVVGARVTDTEDAQAVIGAFREGLQTTAGQPPLAVTLDNRPSNFASQIDDALSCTELLRATPGRGQAKAPVEGAFGLFEQSLPAPIVLAGETDQDIARAFAQQVVTAFFRGRNGRPRRKLAGLTPAQAYDQSSPSPEQINEARKYILERRRREKIARQTREQRADPVRRKLVGDQLVALGIDDPAGEVSLSLCGYSLTAILRGVAIYHGKKELGTLPADHDPYRYLGGIIRNVDATEHLERTAQHLLKLRQRAGDLQLIPLQRQADAILETKSASAAASAFVDAALDATSELTFRFWSSHARESLCQLPKDQAIALYCHLTRVISAASRALRKRREHLIAVLSAAVAPVAA